MDYILVTPSDLRSHWPRIKQSLEAVQARAPQDWIPEDVYFALKSGNAACHIAINDAGYAGMMVAHPSRAEFSGEQFLHVWIAHNEGEDDVIELGMDLLREMAARGGFRKVTFTSPRVGWAKRHKLVTAIYEVEL